MWRLLSRYRPKFTRQLPVGGYILDLACRQAKVAVEIDGSQHHDAHDYDAERTAFLESLGWQVIRLWNNDVIANPIGAVGHVFETIARRIGTHPQPLPFREGRARRPSVASSSQQEISP